MTTRITYGATSFTPLRSNQVLKSPSDRFSSTPMMIPPSAAPRMESSPPRMVAGKTFRPKW
jgi:hypothetical protein